MRTSKLVSFALHAAVFASLWVPWPGGCAGQPFAKQSQIFVPRPSEGRPAETEHPCRRPPCLGEQPRPTGRNQIPSPPGEDLEFVDDTDRVLLPALRRAGGWVAFVSRSDRARAVAIYGVADGQNLGAGTDLGRYPLRLVVHEPESYLQIATWMGGLGLPTETLRTLAVFPPQTQARLHEAIEAEAKRTGLHAGPRLARLKLSPNDAIGIAVLSVVGKEPRPTLFTP